METDDGRARQMRLEGQVGRTAEREARSRGTMRRSRLVERPHDAPAIRDCFEVRREDGLGNRDHDRGWLDDGVVQPNDSSFVAPYFGAVVIVGLEVSMGNDVRMVKIGFVNVLRRDNWQQHHAWRQHAGNRRAPE